MSCLTKLFGSFDLILGLVSLIIQIIAAVFGDVVIEGIAFELGHPTDNYGAGIWCGVVFLVTGIAALRYAMSKDGTWKIVLIVVAVLAICCGVVQIAVAGVTLDDVKGLGQLGEQCSSDLQFCITNITSGIDNSTLLCSDAILGNFCDVQTIYQAILITSGCIAVITNFFLILLAFCSCC